MAERKLTKKELKKLIDGYREKLEKSAISVERMYLFGSYAKGNPHPESDVDLCVISSDFKDRIESTMTLMKLRSDDELLISPIAFSPESFTEENPLAWEVKNTGVVFAG